jgi:hypothetical protein
MRGAARRGPAGSERRRGRPDPAGAPHYQPARLAEVFAAAIGWDGVHATITDDQAAAWADWCAYHRRRVR